MPQERERTCMSLVFLFSGVAFTITTSSELYIFRETTFSDIETNIGNISLLFIEPSTSVNLPFNVPLNVQGYTINVPLNIQG